MGFTVSSKTEMYTQISNQFIHKFLPKADGSFIKVYLYLLMIEQHSDANTNFTIDTLADSLECSEGDICRALKYWVKEGVLELSFSSSNEKDITGITILPIPNSFDLDTNTNASVTYNSDTTISCNTSVISHPSISLVNFAKGKIKDNVLPTNDTESLDTTEKAKTDDSNNDSSIDSYEAPAKSDYSESALNVISQNDDIKNTLSSIEETIGRPITPKQFEMVVYFMCDVGFSAELTTTLFKVAKSRGKLDARYINKVGLEWDKKGIKTSEDALNESANFSGKYSVVSKAFGLHRPLAPEEMKIVDEWDAFNFSRDIITEACNRTILQTGKIALEYTTAILSRWSAKDVQTLDDVAKLDKQHNTEVKNNSSKNSKRTTNQFQQFPQREYSNTDFNSLEKKLLQG